MKICLVVDESPMVRRILAVMLDRLGFAIVEAETGERALALCQDQLPDLALIDWTLPDDAGIALAQNLRKLPGGERVKLVMCTNERSVAQIEAAVAAGADEYVTKPFGLDILQTKLGYLGFELPADDTDGAFRRQLSRVGLAGMTVAEPEEIRVASGDHLFHKGDVPDFAYILLSGRMKIGPTLVEPFMLFGEMALTENLPRPQDAKAISDCSLMRISKQRFQAEMAATSPLLRNWIECLTDRSRDVT
jgi:two-component system chemotaxis response regulator CheY